MARLENRTVKSLSLDSDLGDDYGVEMPNGKTVYGVVLTAEKGSLDSGSWDNADQIRDLFDNINVAVQQEDFTDVRGEVASWYDIAATGEPTANESTPSGDGRRGQIVIPFENPVPTSQVNQKEINLDVAALTDITSGGASSQTGSKIQVGVIVGDQGSMSQYTKVFRDPQNLQSGDGRTFDLNLVGKLTRLAMHEDTGAVSHLKVTAVMSGDSDEVILDASIEQIKEQARKEIRGSGEIPDDVTFLPLKESVDYSKVEELKFEADVSSGGDIELFPLTLHNTEKTLTA